MGYVIKNYPCDKEYDIDGKKAGRIVRIRQNLAYAVIVSLITTVTILLVSQELFAQSQPIPLSPKTRYLALDSLVDILEDRAGNLTWDELSSQRKQRYWSKSPGNLNFGFTDSAYWVRTTFSNPSNQDLSFLLEIAYPIIDSIKVYIQRQGSIETFDMGDRIPFDQRPVNVRNFVFPVSLDAKEVVMVFVRFETNNAMQMPMSLYHPREYIEKKQANDATLGLYFGAMIVLMIYNLFLFSSVRDVDYLYYSMYVFCLCLFLAGVNGITIQYFFPSKPHWNDPVLGLAMNGVLFTGSFLAINFLKIKNVWPGIYRVFMAFSLSAGVLALLALIIPYKYTVMMAMILTLVLFLYGMPVVFFRWFKGFYPARYHAMAWVALCGGVGIVAANKLGFLPRVFWTENAIQVGSIFQVVLLSISLADRLNMERRKKIEAQERARSEEHLARISQKKALQNERKEREAMDELYATQKGIKDTLEIKVAERKKDLDQILSEVKLANSRTMSSLRYASIIQMAMLSDPENIRTWLPRHFIWWAPRDVVGGDFYYMDRIDDVGIVCLADCTGHNVHRAFMTIVSGFELKRIVREQRCLDPGGILERLNLRLRSFLRPLTGKVLIDDGLRIGVCILEPKKSRIRFAGAKMNLHALIDGQVRTIEGNRDWLGFMASQSHAAYDVHQLDYDSTLKLYLATDGVTGQPGERSGKRFGAARLRQILTEHAELPFPVQHEILEASLKVYRGNRDQVDDITMVGFSPE